jgi:hypothetical protein
MRGNRFAAAQGGIGQGCCLSQEGRLTLGSDILLTRHSLKAIWMAWDVAFHDEFVPEFKTFEASVQDGLLAVAKLLADYGPQPGRPHAGTLKGSKHANMKELRFEGADGAWRAAFAFDPERRAILLVAGDKSGGSQKRFYRQLIAKADSRFSAHAESLKAGNRKV